MHLEDQAPLLRGCPDRGGERQREGPIRCAATFGRRAERVASHAKSVQGHYGGMPAAHPRTARISRDPSGGTSPSAEGLPRQGREGPAREGPRVAQQRVGRRAERVASRASSVQGHYGGMPAAHPRTARISRDASGGPSPSVEGLPRQGRGEAGKGRGPYVAQQRLGRRAERVASRASSVQGHYGGMPAAHPRTARISRDASGGPSPSVEGLPRQGRERPAKGGAHTLRSNVWGDAQSASRPRQIKKRLPKGSPFLYLAERGIRTPRRYKRLPDFESGTFNHSATSPGGPRRTGDAHHTRK